MTSDRKFCEDCGKPLASGAKFCEDCGTPVKHNTVLEEEGTPGVPISPGTPYLPLAVMPFGYRNRGMFSTEPLTLVIYPDQIVLAFIPKSREAEFDKAMIDVQAELMKKHIEGKSLWQLAAGAGTALFKLGWSPVDFYTTDSVMEQKMLRNLAIPTRPWEEYLSMRVDGVLAEDPRNLAIPRESIAFIRGESDPSTNTDQILLYSAGGRFTIFFQFGVFFPARKTLFSFLLPGPFDREQTIGVIPYADEPEVEGFGFQYSWIVVVTEKRLIFFMIEDEFADELSKWTKEREKDAKKSGRELQEREILGRSDAPWQRFRNRTISSLLENEVNFFIPLSAILSADLIPNGPGQAVELCIHLPGEPYDIQFPAGSEGHIQNILGPVLSRRLNS